jgi:hypothetical protein
MKSEKPKMSVHHVHEVEISYFDYLSNNSNSQEYMSIQTWHNGEGYTVFYGDNTSFSFTHAQWNAMKKGIKYLNEEVDKAREAERERKLYEN